MTQLRTMLPLVNAPNRPPSAGTRTRCRWGCPVAKPLVRVFRNFELAEWWHVEFKDKVSMGMDKQSAIRYATTLADHFGAKMVVKRFPGLKAR